MKIKFTEEILKDFKEQYPDEIQLYEGLLRGKYKYAIEGIKIYNSMIDSLDFLINLMMELNKTQSLN